jgi:hypothetical protein
MLIIVINDEKVKIFGTCEDFFLGEIVMPREKEK